MSLFLVNDRIASSDRERDEAFAFQAEIEVRSSAPFVPRPDPREVSGDDWDEHVADLHYAHTPEYAAGHGLSADWELVDGACRVLRTTWTPVAEVEKTETFDPPGAVLSAKLMSMTGVPNPRLYAPPPEPESWQERQRGIGAWRFPEWFVVQESGARPGAGTRSSTRSRRMVPRTALANGRYDKKPVVATRFVRACSKGHVDDIDWYQFVHGPDDPCRRRLWLDERGTSGDLVEQIVRCECGRSRRMHEAVDFASFPLGVCRGRGPGWDATRTRSAASPAVC